MKFLLIHILLPVILVAPIFGPSNDEHGGARKLGGNHLIEFSLSKEPAVCPHHKLKIDV